MKGANSVGTKTLLWDDEKFSVASNEELANGLESWLKKSGTAQGTHWVVKAFAATDTEKTDVAIKKLDRLVRCTKAKHRLTSAV